MASSSSRPYFATSARASASVVGSGTVGPDAIAEASSCGTSEIASVTISARCPARASRPPLIRDRCLRTVLTSPIGAPERSSARLTCCFCANDTPSTGAIQLAEPPPDSSTSSRSSAPGLRGEPQAVFRALQAGLVGHGMAGLHHPDPPRRHAVAVAGGRDAGEPRWRQSQFVEIVPLRGRGHGGGALAGGETNHAAFRHRTQMPRQHDFGMRGGNGGVEHRAQERASVGHAVTGCGLRDMRRRLSIRLAQKKTPAACCGGCCASREGLRSLPPGFSWWRRRSGLRRTFPRLRP